MKKWIKADNGRVTQVIEFDDGSKMELPLDKGHSCRPRKTHKKEHKK